MNEYSNGPARAPQPQPVRIAASDSRICALVIGGAVAATAHVLGTEYAALTYNRAHETFPALVAAYAAGSAVGYGINEARLWYRGRSGMPGAQGASVARPNQ